MEHTGKEVKDILNNFKVTMVISDGDLRVVLNWYKNLIEFFSNDASFNPMVTGLICEYRSYQNIASARRWEVRDIYGPIHY
jgi:hypothetical protein